jgi:diguanylate cyclase (GGDEF)-like protein
MIASSSLYQKAPEIQKLDPEVFSEDYAVTVVVVPDTNILQLTVEGPDPELVVVIANAIGNQALTYINQIYPVYNFSILDQPTQPTSPIRPQPIQNAGLALLFGALVGLVLAFSREQLQNTIDKLRERSIIDAASSAFTRAHFERRLLEEITQRPTNSLSFAIINLRGLEEIYNVIPEPIFNRVINNVTKKLKSELRGRDIVGRWGDSQLAVILPGTPSSAVEATCKRIQVYLAESIAMDNAGDMVINPDPCIGVVSRDQFETSESVIERAQLAIEKASALEEAGVVFLSKPFLFDETPETNS